MELKITSIGYCSRWNDASKFDFQMAAIRVNMTNVELGQYIYIPGGFLDAEGVSPGFRGVRREGAQTGQTRSLEHNLVCTTEL